MSSLDKMLSVLDLFTADTLQISPIDVQDQLGLPRATAYRYLKSLTDAGLLARFAGGYVPGPRAIELDHLVRLGDPLVRASERVLAAVSAAHDCDLQILSISGGRILVTSHVRSDGGVTVSYGRGRTMPALLGAGGRMILAMLPAAKQKALIGDPALWEAQRPGLAATRRAGFTISHGELEPGNVGVAVPIVHPALGAPSALVMILPEGQFSTADQARTLLLLRASATLILANLDGRPTLADSGKAAPATAPASEPAQVDAAPPIGLAADLAGASEAQRRVVEIIASGPRGEVPSPFLAMLDAPELALAIQQVGAVIRFGATLPDDLREIAILATAGAVRCGYEWNYHAPLARDAGVAEATIAAARPDASARGLAAPHGTIITLCRELIAQHQVMPATMAAAVAQLGRTGTSECVAIAGYYALLAGFIRSAGFDQPFESQPQPAQ